MMIGTRRAILNNRFNPLSISGLSIWLDAQDSKTISLSGSNVTQWSDKSGKGNHAVQGTGVNQPVLVASGINGKPAIRGFPSGVQSKLNITDNASLAYSEYTAFTVCQMNNYSAIQNNFIYGKYDVTANQREFLHAITNNGKLGGFLSADGTSFGFFEHLEVFPANVAEIITSQFNNASFESKRFNRSTLNSSSVASLFNGSSVYALFGRPSLNDYFDGWIGEHLFFNRALSGVEIANINNYLSKKWGVV